MGLYFVGSTRGGLFYGHLADKLGEKKVLHYFFFGLIITSMLGIYSLFANNLFLFILSKVLEGFMLGRVAVMSYLSHSAEAKTSVFRKIELMNAVGLFIGPALCGFLTDFQQLVPLYYYTVPIHLIFIMAVCGFALINTLPEQLLRSV